MVSYKVSAEIFFPFLSSWKYISLHSDMQNLISDDFWTVPEPQTADQKIYAYKNLPELKAEID